MNRLRHWPSRRDLPAIAVAAVLCVALVVVVYTHRSLFSPDIDESGLEWAPSGNVSDADQARDEVGELMATLQDPQDNDLGTVTGKLASDQSLAIDLVSSHGIDIPSLCEHLFASATYTLGQVSVEGDDATVELTVSHKPFGRVANEANAAFGELLSADGGDSLLSQGVDALLARYEELYLSQLDSTTDMVTDDFTVGLTKTNGTWTIDSDSIRDMASTFVEGVDLPVDV